MAIKLAITSDPSEFCVWAMLDDDSFNQAPHDRGESFVLATGPTVHVALDLAIKELQKAAGDAQVLSYDAIKPEGVFVIPVAQLTDEERIRGRLQDLGAFFVDGILEGIDVEVAGAVDEEYRRGLRARLITRLAAAMNLAIVQEVEAIAVDLTADEP